MELSVEAMHEFLRSSYCPFVCEARQLSLKLSSVFHFISAYYIKYINDTVLILLSFDF